MRSSIILLAVLAVITGCGCNKEDGDDTPVATVISASGDITAKVDDFRNILGSVLNTTPGQTSGRREINWDAVPDQFATQKLPHDFFNPVAPGSPANLQKGFIYSPDTDNDARISVNNFSDLEATNATEFSTFSGNKSFSAVSSNLWNVEFEVAGTRTDASVKGLGIVFSDVDDANSTTMEYFSGDRSLGVYKVPVRSAGSTFSFLGVYFPDEKVTKVRVRQGNGVVASGVKDISAGGTKDLVIMDDFLYDEPKALH